LSYSGRRPPQPMITDYPFPDNEPMHIRVDDGIGRIEKRV